ncbi:MAG: alpha/beta fold hydrolase [Sandaracinaceae bacterium]|nr:alpha/beta fold hydrolase [Sandaracinaceae bacterium]
MSETCESCTPEPLEPKPAAPEIFAAHPCLGGAAFSPTLRKAAELRDGFAILCRALTTDPKGRKAPSADAVRLAALAVTGYGAWTALRARWTKPVWTWGTVEGMALADAEGLTGPVDVERAVELVMQARAIALCLTANDPDYRDPARVALLPATVQKELAGGRAAMRRRLGAEWIPVVGEVDAPHRAVNVGATPLIERRTGPFTFDANQTRTKRRSYVADARYVLEGPKDAPAVVLLHGHSSKLEELDAVVPLLSDRFRVLVPDLPGGSGFTRGELPPASTKTFRTAALDYLLDFVLALVDRLRASGELPKASRKIHFAGGSLGGNLALRLNARAATIAGASRFAAWSPGSAWYFPSDPDGDTSSPWMVHGWGTAEDRMTRDPALTTKYGWKDYFQLLSKPVKIAGLEVLDAQPEHWYWSEWYPDLRTQYFEECYESRREIFSAGFRAVHWQLAWEQLRFSHHGIGSDTKHPYDAYTAPLLLMAGCRDNLFPERLATATHDLYGRMRAAKMKRVFWRGFCDAGHSLHNERPEELAKVLGEWFANGNVA